MSNSDLLNCIVPQIHQRYSRLPSIICRGKWSQERLRYYTDGGQRVCCCPVSTNQHMFTIQKHLLVFSFRCVIKKESLDCRMRNSWWKTVFYHKISIWVIMKIKGHFIQLALAVQFCFTWSNSNKLSTLILHFSFLTSSKRWVSIPEIRHILTFNYVKT